MEPLLEHRTCPTCPGLIAGADPQRLCFQCLGPNHAEEGLGQSSACNACRMIPQLSRRHRGEHFQVKFGPQVEDQDLEVVEMDELHEVPFEFTLLRGPVAAFAEGEDDKDASLSDTFSSGGQEGPAHRSARLDFPAVMNLAAEHVALPLPLVLPQRRNCGYGLQRLSPGESEARTSVSHPSGFGWRRGTVVLRDDTEEGGPALGCSPVLGGDVSRGRCNRGVTHSGPTSPDLVPEKR